MPQDDEETGAASTVSRLTDAESRVLELVRHDRPHGAGPAAKVVAGARAALLGAPEGAPVPEGEIALDRATIALEGGLLAARDRLDQRLAASVGGSRTPPAELQVGAGFHVGASEPDTTERLTVTSDADVDRDPTETVPQIPPGSTLVHIGSPKTGSTSIQYGVHRARGELGKYGVRYPGQAAHHRREMNMLRSAPDIRELPIAAELAAGGFTRALLSDETLATFGGDVPRRVHDLVGDEGHIALVLRNVASLLPSLWQQDVKKGDPRSQEQWLSDGEQDPRIFNIFDESDGENVVSRWAGEFGADRMVVIILDQSAPERLFNVFESMLGMPSGTLAVSQLNRGMTAPEIEIIRSLNARVRSGPAVLPRVQRALQHYGAVDGLMARTPVPGEPKPALPAASADLAVRLADSLIDALASSGVRVVGDPAELRRLPRLTDDVPPVDPAVLAEISASALHGMLLAGADEIARIEGFDLRGWQEKLGRTRGSSA
ncbi:hypothetical protein [Cellulomonas composti]|nr:hypothetical protein [Cellulomonas composti]